MGIDSQSYSFNYLASTYGITLPLPPARCTFILYIIVDWRNNSYTITTKLLHIYRTDSKTDKSHLVGHL